DPDRGHPQPVRGAQVLEHVVDERAAVRIDVVLAQQHAKAVQRRLAAVARILDRIDRVEVPREPHRAQHARDVMARSIGEHELHAPEALERMLERVLVHHQVAELREDVGLRQEAARVDAVMAHEAVQRGAVAQPELLAHAVCARLVDAELAPQERVDLVVHRRKDARGSVVQRVVEVEDPHAPRRRQAGNAHYLLLISVPTPWSVSTSRSSALGTRPSMMCTAFTPLRAASSAEPILGSMPPEMTPFATRSSMRRGVSPVRSLPSLSRTPGVLVSTTSFSARSTSASLPATRSALML